MCVRYFMILALGLVLTSCGPRPRNIIDKTKVEGRVINGITRKSTGGVSVRLIEYTSRPFGTDTYTVLKESLTNQEGEFEFSFSASLVPDTRYHLEAYLWDGILNQERYLGGYGIVKHKSNFPVMEITLNCQLRLGVFPRSCEQGDNLIFSFQMEFDSSGLGPDSILIDDFRSTINDPLLSVLLAGDAYLWWQIEKENGRIEQFRDTLSCMLGEGIDYIIKY